MNEKITAIVDDETRTEVSASERRLGNPELPIADYAEEIVEAVDGSSATIITAETGAGKSTQVPQYLAEAGYGVVVTQPRIVAARSLAEHLRDELTEPMGDAAAAQDFVGYRTAHERDDSPSNRVLFATDGLQLVRELSGNGAGKKQVLVLDEVHEWNENMEVLVAWARQRMEADPNFKTVIMSATMEAEPLAKYFAGDKRSVPVIEVPGRTFPVEKYEEIVSQSQIYSQAAAKAAELAAAGQNTLVFVPGKAEIEDVMNQITQKQLPSVTVLPLHGQLDKKDQRKVFLKYPGAKVIVATNVAQTSLTIEDIDAVVDTGMERRNEIKNGVEGLYLRPISKADCLQRAGRAGRTKAGEYYLVSTNGFDERDDYGTPEIMRTRLDGTVLRLAKAGFDAETMNFYHQPDRNEIVEAEDRLVKLGAFDKDGSITKIGRQMERIPLESHYARMMIEARQYSQEVRAQLAAMLAVQEVGGVTYNGKSGSGAWRQLTSGNTVSDGIAQLEVFIAASKLSYKEARDYDIMMKNLSRSRDVYRQIRRTENIHDIDLTIPTEEQQTQLVKCIVAGMADNLYVRTERGYYHSAQDEGREISNRSVVENSQMVVGMPFDLQITTRRGGSMTLKLIEGVTRVSSIEILREVAPQLLEEKDRGFGLDGEGHVIERRQAYYNGIDTGVETFKLASESSERHDWLVNCALSRSDDIQSVLAEIRNLYRRSGRPDLEEKPEEYIKQLLKNVITPKTDNLETALQQVPKLSLTDVVPAETVAAIKAASPDEFAGLRVSYCNGQPQVRMSNDELRAWEGPTSLPDGREIKLANSFYHSSIASRRAELIKDK